MRGFAMMVRGLGLSRVLLLPTLTLVACLPLAGAATPSVAAEFCATGVAGIATSCETAWELAQDLARRRSDRTLAADPARERVRRLDHKRPPQGDTAVPFAMSGDGDNINFNTSLTQWGSALSTADLESLKQAQRRRSPPESGNDPGAEIRSLGARAARKLQ
jgi:hypothetical protein